ncbi:glycosyltransferase [Longitalea arenae]|uniref:glycosyltransferase n=1 Tax=Longitalea arenae TaxID=2812558 RepID=UPI001967BD49|nr:glycosyltransferase [Longitalea arenae]
MPKVSIIIPCFNEERRLKKEPLLQLLHSGADIALILVNDGSTDNTHLLLEEIRKVDEEHVVVITYRENKGKANAVFKGMEHALENHNPAFIGYLDADLSTGVDEFLRLAETAKHAEADYAFGSRIKMLNHEIYRSVVRHICGRIITTIIDSRYQLSIYDTQCGAKLFSPEIVKIITRTPFKTRWLFDVEIFLRIRNAGISAKGLEIPLKKWTHYGNSKISLLSAPQICGELIRLAKNYKITK